MNSATVNPAPGQRGSASALPLRWQVVTGVVRDAAPYFTQLLWNLQQRAVPGLGTLAVDRWGRLYVDPEIVDRWTVGQMATGLLHEIIHVLSRHCTRCSTCTDEQLKNVAADLAANCWLEGIIPDANKLLMEIAVKRTAGITNSRGVSNVTRLSLDPKDWPQNFQPLRVDHFDFKPNLMFEEYVELLLKMKKDDPVKYAKLLGGGDNDGKPHPGGGCCGSCATGIKAPWEEGPAAPDGSDGLSEDAIAAYVYQVAQAAAAHAAKRGVGLGGLGVWANEQITPPKISWQERLRRRLRHSYHSISQQFDVSWRRLSRRSQDIMMPGQERPIPSITMVWDTSGSMHGLHDKVAAEVQGLFAQCGRVDQRLIVGDWNVQSNQVLRSLDQVERIMGGGGTSMATLCKVAFEQRPKPHLVVVFTDGETDHVEDHEVPSGTELLYVLIGVQAPEPPDYIEFLRVTDDD